MNEIIKPIQIMVRMITRVNIIVIITAVRLILRKIKEHLLLQQWINLKRVLKVIILSILQEI